MIIRPATAADIPAILAIWNPHIRDSAATFNTVEQSPEMLAAEIAARAPGFLVAEAAGAVQGFASYGPFRAGPGYAHSSEHRVILGPGAQRRGIGRALMARLEEIARAQDIHVLIAGVSGENPGAIAFHEAIGFARVGHLPQVGRKFGRWMDLIFLQKTL